VATKLINDIIRIDVLEEEIQYYRSLLQPHDTGHINTTINFLQNRINNLKGKYDEWPFKNS